MTTRHYQIGQGIKQACAVLSISPARVLARCGLPRDFLENEGRGIDAQTWMSVVPELAAESGDPDFPLVLGRNVARGPFQPALLAFSASPNIATGLTRLKLFKPLVAPINLVLHEDAETFSAVIHPSEDGLEMPGVTSALEIVCFIELMRMFTALPITPLAITLPDLRFATDAFRAFVGCPIQSGGSTGIVLSIEAAQSPLISADTEFYKVLEKELLARLDLSQTGAVTRDRVRSELIEMLPSGRVSLDAMCDRLRTSKRSLQRKLKDENTSFQAILDETRASLALTYLRDQGLSAEETSYLLAFQDPNSFYRAFHDWTGMTPSQARSMATDV